MTALYKLTDELKECEALLMSGELTEEMLADTLNALSSEFKDKAASVALFIKTAERISEACKDEQARLKERQQYFDRQASSMKDYLLNNLLAIGETKIIDPLVTISIRKPSKVVVIDDEENIPSFYLKSKTVTSVDRREIAKQLKAGESVSGAHLEDGKQSITIK